MGYILVMTKYLQTMYRKGILSFCILIILSLGGSCTKKDNKLIDSHLINIELNNNPMYLSSLFDSIKPVFFETNKSSLIGENPNVIFTEKATFIKSDNNIKIFNPDGKYLNNIKKTGNGNGEYTAISDFFINEPLNRVEILDKRQKKILYYNYNGEYIDDQFIAIWAIKIFRDAQNRLYIYSGYERDESNKFQFNVTDGVENYSFSEIDKNKSEFLHISNRTNFFKSGKDKILFFEPFNDTIYTLKKDRLIPEYIISYNGQNVPESFYRNNNFSNVFEFFQELKKHNYINSTYNVIETDSKVFFYCLKGTKKYLVVYDKIDKKAYSYDRIIDDYFTSGAELPFQDEGFMFFAKNNTVMFFIHPSWFIRNKDRIVSKDITPALRNLNEEDNPVGIFCSFK